MKPRTPAQQARRSAVKADGTPARVTRRRAETRARLLDAGFSVFARKGFGAARIEDVCEAAGYSRGAFYSNFDDLDELFFAMYQQRAEIIAGQVAGALAGADLPGSVGTVGTVGTVIEALLVDRDWVLVKTEFLLYAARNPAAGQELRAQRARLRKTLAGSLAPAIDTARLPEALRQPDDLAQAVIAVHDGAMEHLLLYPEIEPLRAWLTDMLTALLS